MSWRDRDRGYDRDRDRGSWRDRDRDGGGYGGKGKGKGGGGPAVEEDTSRDWNCESCGTRNFARRDECFKCKAPRPRAEGEAKDLRAERERKIKAAIAMGYDPDMAETIIMDPRFAESIDQMEKMQKANEEAQKTAQRQQQLAMAMAMGLNMQQAEQYVQQQETLQKQLQEQQEQAEKLQREQQQAAAAAPAPAPDANTLMMAALALGYTPEQAQAYVQSCMQESAAATTETSKSESEKPAKKENKVELYANTPLILNMDEGRRGYIRTTLKAVLLGDDPEGRRFNDVFIKGPWRRSREEAQMDQDELTKAFKYDGETGVKEKCAELDDKDWTTEELEKATAAAAAAAAALVDAAGDDDFDAEAESEEEKEEDRTFDKEELPVKLRGPASDPIHSWEEGVARGCIAPKIRDALEMMQMTKPTLIQKFSLPLIGCGTADVLAQAQTGSGKTLAFVIPVMSRLLMSPPVDRPFFPGQSASASPVALMLSPTRELAIQTNKNVSDLLKHAGSSMTTLCMYGGEALSQQLKPIERQQQDFLCATAGRLLDAIDQGKVSLMFAKIIVLDEADQMLDLAVGLEGTVMQITEGRDLPGKNERQTCLFSATMPEFQTRQFHAVLKKPPLRVKLRVGHYTEDEKGGSCKHITQQFIRVRDMEDRWRRFGRDIMENWGRSRSEREGKGIVFTNRIALAQPLEQALGRVGIPCGQLHGKQTQDVREDVVNRFRKGEYEMLIASNVASRGLDFPDIKLVVQFELPKTVEIYTHRIGRTGRNGQTGKTLAYWADKLDDIHAPKLAEFLSLNDQEVPGWMEDLAYPDRRRHRGRSRSRSRDRDRDRDRGRRRY